MKKLVNKYGYFIPNKYKQIDTTKYKFSNFYLLDKEWKLYIPDLLKLVDVIDSATQIETDSIRLNRESRSSLAIENVYKDSTEEYVRYIDNLDAARKELFKYDYLDKKLINKIYLLASNNEELIDKDNIKLEGKSLFRYDDIFIGNNKVPYKEKKLESYVEELCEHINKLINEEEIFIASVTLHFFFEHLHPLPDYNGRVGRLLLSWCLSKGFPDYDLSNFILNNKNDYYESISLSEKYSDLTYSLIFFLESIIVNNVFSGLFLNSDSKLSEIFKSLNEPEQQALFNLFTRRNEFAWKEYKEYFKDSRSKQQIHNILSSLEKKGLIKSKTYANNLKRYYYE